MSKTAPIARMTEGRFDLSKFIHGWAVSPGAEVAHYFVRKQGGIISDCGIRYRPEMRDAKGFVLFGQGSFCRCKRCERA